MIVSVISLIFIKILLWILIAFIDYPKTSQIYGGDVSIYIKKKRESAQTSLMVQRSIPSECRWEGKPSTRNKVRGV